MKKRWFVLLRNLPGRRGDLEQVVGIDKVSWWFQVIWFGELAGCPGGSIQQALGNWYWPLNQACLWQWPWCGSQLLRDRDRDSWSHVKVCIPGGFGAPWLHNSDSPHSVLWSYAPGRAAHTNCSKSTAPSMPSSFSGPRQKMYKDSHWHVKWEGGTWESVKWWKMERMKWSKFQGVLGSWCQMF